MIDLDSIDPDDPFEVDQDNGPHLFAHAALGLEDALDVWWSDPVFLPAEHGPAELLMIARVAGELLLVPLVEARFRPDQVRPIGVYKVANAAVVRRYEDETR